MYSPIGLVIFYASHLPPPILAYFLALCLIPFGTSYCMFSPIGLVLCAKFQQNPIQLCCSNVYMKVPTRHHSFFVSRNWRGLWRYVGALQMHIKINIVTLKKFQIFLLVSTFFCTLVWTCLIQSKYQIEVPNTCYYLTLDAPSLNKCWQSVMPTRQSAMPTWMPT